MNNLCKTKYAYKQLDLSNEETLTIEKIFNDMKISDEDKEKVKAFKEKFNGTKQMSSVEINPVSGGMTEISVDDHIEEFDKSIKRLEERKLNLISHELISSPENTKEKMRTSLHEAFITFYDSFNKGEHTSEEVFTVLCDYITELRAENDLNTKDEFNKFITDASFDELNVPQIIIDMITGTAVDNDKKFAKKEYVGIIKSLFNLMSSSLIEVEGLDASIDKHNRMITLLTKLSEEYINDMRPILENPQPIRTFFTQEFINNGEINNKFNEVIKNPSKFQNIYTMQKFTCQKLADSYDRVLLEMEADNAPEEELTYVKNEIELNRRISEAYSSILNLEHLRPHVNILASTGIEKRIKSEQGLKEKCIDIIKNIRKSKFSFSFPGYEGGKTSDKMLLYNYERYIGRAIMLYNKAAGLVNEDGGEAPIIDKYSYELIADVILLILGRYVDKVKIDPKTMTRIDCIMELKIANEYMSLVSNITGEMYVLPELCELTYKIISLFKFIK